MGKGGRAGSWDGTGGLKTPVIDEPCYPAATPSATGPALCPVTSGNACTPRYNAVRYVHNVFGHAGQPAASGVINRVLVISSERQRPRGNGKKKGILREGGGGAEQKFARGAFYSHWRPSFTFTFSLASGRRREKMEADLSSRVNGSLWWATVNKPVTWFGFLLESRVNWSEL